MYKSKGVWYYKAPAPPGSGKKYIYFNLGKNKATARTLEMEIKKNLARKSSASLVVRITVGDLLRDWYFEKFCKVEHRPNTLKADRHFINRISEKVGHIFLTDLAKADILQAIEDRRAEGVGQAGIRREWTILKHALNLAVQDWEMIPASPMASVRLPKDRSDRIRYLLPDEETALFRTLADPAFHWLRPVVVIARETGLRRGDLVAHEWGQVDFKNCQTVIRTSKAGTPIMVPWSSDCFEAYSELNKVRNLRSARVILKGGKPVSGNWLSKQFLKATRAAGIQDFHFHDLRHDFISRLVQAGVEIFLVKEMAGHKTIQSTMKYAHLAPHQKCSAIERMERDRKNSITFYPPIARSL